MDDILLAAPTKKEQQDAFTSLQTQLSLYSLNIAPEKIQIDFPIQYLGYTLGAQKYLTPKDSNSTRSFKNIK